MTTSPSAATYDTIVVGGGAAGLMAATMLARANRQVLVYDAGKQSNRVSHEAHGVFTRDNIPPQELYEIATEQLLRYPTAEIRSETVSSIAKSKEDNFTVTTTDGSVAQARTILLAQGMNYNVPSVEGLQQLWGTKAWHCPYCEGYESQGKRLLAIMKGSWREHMANLLPVWNPPIAVVGPEEVLKITHTNDSIRAYLRNGSTIEADQIATEISQTPRDTLAQMLGCRLTDSGHVAVDEKHKTSIEGVYAAGDQIMPRGQVNLAAASGHTAAISINTYLVFTNSQQVR